MSRAFRLTSGAFVVVCALAGAAAAKPSIAILGLEVIDKSGTPSNDDVQFAKNLTEGLRARAKIGGPYVLAPTGDKELIDLKLLKGCDDEKPSCMSSIGGDLNADFLIYGSVTKKKQGNYDISVAFLDVHAGKRERTIPTSIPVGTGGVALQNQAKKIYNGLTGQADSCTITIKTPGVERGTILINGKEAGNITNGVGSVNGLSEGKYSIAIEANNYHRYTKGDVQCTGGETTNIQATLDKMDKAVIPAPNTVTPNETPTNDNHDIQGTVSHSHSHKAVWKTMAYGGLIGTAIGGAVWVFGYEHYTNNAHFDTKNLVIPSTATVKDASKYDDSMCGTADGNAVVATDGIGNKAFKKGCSGKTWTTVGVPLTIGFAAISAVGFVMLYSTSDSEEKQVVSGRRHHEPFAITPVISPTGGGATFRMEW